MRKTLLAIMSACLALNASAQSKLYPQHFDLNEVTLTDGPLKQAQDINFKHLLEYDTDRLLTPFVRQAGLSTGTYANWTAVHPNFDNWGSGNFRLDGHVGGHYLSALALAYAACHDAATKALLKERMDRMIDVLSDCQDVFNDNTKGLYGYIGGYPDNSLWTDMFAGSTAKFNAARGNVPLYVQHKVMAGLRDAYVYADSEKAKDMFLKLCDWAINLVAKYSATTMQSVLDTEHGGINEVLADAYYLTRDKKYLDAAKKYSHAMMIDGMQTVNKSFLDNRHANTQVPKYIGFERIAQLEGTNTKYATAASNFFTDVTENRTVCIGGNSMNEWFMASSASQRYVDETNGPESCNTNNMLKLTEMLFDATHNDLYTTYYETDMYNHILSTQDPNTGGYVYFTPLRPQSYRIYSKANQDMWCCVGTGMENHSKYGHFTYTHDGNANLYVNLFMPSELNSEKFGIKQETAFPFGEDIKLTVTKAGTYSILVRIPAWTDDSKDIHVNGEQIAANDIINPQGKLHFKRDWKEGDVISLSFPMHITVTQCPNLTDYVAFMYGPILLGARTTSADANDACYEALQHEYAAGERMGHAPDSYTSKKPLSTAPLLIGERNDIVSSITPREGGNTLEFLLPVSKNADRLPSPEAGMALLEPYFAIHHSRVMNYWYQATENDYNNSSWAQAEKAAEELNNRTIDFIRTGEQQSEAGVVSYSDDSTVGTYRDEVYRDNKAGGWTQYILTNAAGVNDRLGIVARFHTADAGRKADIYVDNQLIDTYTIPSDFSTADGNGFFNKEWIIPAALCVDDAGNVKKNFTVRVHANHATFGPGIYYLRLTTGCKLPDLSNPGSDATDTYITNPSFESNVGTKVIPTGWTLNNTSLAWFGVNTRNTFDDNPTDGNQLFGVWNGSSLPVTLSQELTLPAGKYVLTVDMHCSNRNASTIRLGNQRVFAKVEAEEESTGYFKDQNVPGTGDDYPLQTIATAFVVEAESAKVTIGVSTDSAPAETWFKIDNFRLYHSDIASGIDTPKTAGTPSGASTTKKVLRRGDNHIVLHTPQATYGIGGQLLK